VLKIHRNFLPTGHFKVIQRLFMTDVLPWHYNDRVVTTERQFMFVHPFINDGKIISPNFLDPVQAMLQPMQRKCRFVGISRIKANLYTNQGRSLRHPTHFDIPPDSGVANKYRIAVYHVNTCNGMTVVDGREVQSEENQLLVFENVAHYGTVQTDTDTRIVINFVLRIE
jgi:hypothetical protein